MAIGYKTLIEFSEDYCFRIIRIALLGCTALRRIGLLLCL